MGQPGDITSLLPAWGIGGDAEARLFEVIEPELLKLARSALHSRPEFASRLEPGELVNEVYIRLKKYIGSHRDVSFENRRRFFAMVLKTMRSVLLDAAKRGGQSKPRTSLVLPLSVDGVQPATSECAVELTDFYIALDRLRAKNERQAEALELHYIAGHTLEESADLLGLSTATLKRQLAAARQWFEIQLRNPSSSS